MRLDAEDSGEFPVIGWPVCLCRSDEIMRHEPGPDLLPAQAQLFNLAMAAKLARLVYRMLRYGTKYVDQGAKFYEAQHRDLQIKQLKWKAAKLGFQVVQPPAA